MPEKNIIWQPHPGPQTIALQRTEREVMYGGARGGGKTDAGLAWLLRYIGHGAYRALIIRKNADDLSDWIERAKMMYRGVGAKFAYKPAEVRFPSGAFFRTGHLNDDDAYMKYQGHEYQRILIEELTQIPSEEMYLRLISSNRSTIPEIPPQVFSTTNPGGDGHLWVKSRFVDVAPPGTPYLYMVGEKQLSRIFIPAKVEDNPSLMQKDPEYVTMLDALPGDLRKAWREGSWDVFEVKGAYYANAMQEARERICKLPFEPHLPVHTAWDLGMNDCMSIWCIQIVKKEIRLLKYIEGEGEGILYYLRELEKRYDNLGTFYFPHDIAVRELGTGRSRLEVAEEWGVREYQVAKRQNPEDGIEAVRQLFPRFWIDEREEKGLNALTQYRKEYDEKNQTFKNKPLHNWASHCADALRTFALCYEDALPPLSRYLFRKKPDDPYDI